MPWGVPVPGDETQVMYVWFDALINYISTLGWPEDTPNFEKFWGTAHHPNAYQMAGKDNLRQQSAMWQAMLMSAGLPPTRRIVIHGFITSGGAKMSKSLGNVIDPYAIVAEYGADPLRLFLVRHIHPFEDSDFTAERFKEAYNADLANGLGNTAARILQLAETNLTEPVARPDPTGLPSEYADALDGYDYNAACAYIWGRLAALNLRLTDEKPFAVVKTDPEKGRAIIVECALELYAIARLLQPFMPQTSAAIKAAVLANKKPANLFPRKD
jgi:methionyl-tRNA synthetase